MPLGRRKPALPSWTGVREYEHNQALTAANAHTWTEQSVYSARHYHQLPAYDPSQSSHDMLTMAEAAQRLGVSTTSVRRLIGQKKLTATQVVACAPWQIPIAALESEAVRTAVDNIKRGARIPQTPHDDNQESLFSMN